MKKEMAKSYNPREFEGRIYDFWMKGNYFHAEVDKDKKPYTIVMPPPNITGQLHMGHALDETLQDILIRWRRMQGYSALWLPGTDHASIATEAKIVEAMREEGLTKEEIGREKFLERAWEWKREYGGRITEQLKKLGSSCDWERERFTMDEGCSKAVKEVFVRLYDDGKIYRGNRMVNWCPHCCTSISDTEVDYEEQSGHFWHLLYKVKETGEYLELATTRPETMLGDTAVAINAKDERYKHLHGCHAILPLLNKEIPIVCDDHADMEKGTGVVKITPAHDPNDFEVGLRNNLPIVRCFTYDGHLTGEEDVKKYEELLKKGNLAENEPEVLDCGKYAGMTTVEARKAILEDLKKCGALKNVEDLTHDVGTCYRCHTTIEPMVSKQWFVKMEPLAKPAIECVKNKKTRIIPDRFEKVYYHWMENIKDWCISRQLWWGHRIPAWYCDDCGEVIVSKTEVDTCPKCGSKKLSQDEDTLDTWFSSALWPFSTLGWPDKTPELDYFFPTNTLVTGYDIIFFWVARMIFSSCEQMKSQPFDTVFMHGIVRDENGVKMSKSLGNGIDPLEVIDKYGADALRFFLATGNSPGNDMRYSDKRVEACANFANKLWNASRFVHMNIDDYDVKNELPKNLATEDKWIVSTLNNVAKEVNANLEKFELGVAVSKLYDFIWDCFCDWYIELSKSRLQGGGAQAESARQVLLWTLDKILKLLHPFMPYITEEIWQTLPVFGETIMLCEYPQYDERINFPEAVGSMEKIMEAIRAIRNRRNEMNVAPSKKAKVYIATALKEVFEQGAPFVMRLASASEVEIGESFDIDGAVTAVTADAKIYIPMDQLVDKSAELERLNKELKSVEKRLAQSEGKLNNQGFISKAPEAVVEKVKGQAQKEREQIAMIKTAIEALGN